MPDVSGIPLRSPLPGLPTVACVRQAYERAVEQFVADHPFLRGRSFASPLFSPTTQRLGSRDRSKAKFALTNAARGVNVVGPFFASFLRAFPRERRRLQGDPSAWRCHSLTLGIKNANIGGEVAGSLLHFGEAVRDCCCSRRNPIAGPREARVVTIVLEDLSGAPVIDVLPQNSSIISGGWAHSWECDPIPC